MKVGVLGGGQLGRMLALAGFPLGLDFVFLDPDPEACAGIIGRYIEADYLDETSLLELASSVDVATVEFESVPSRAVRFLARHVPTYPGEASLAAAQDRLRERAALQAAGVPVPSHRSVSDAEGLLAAVEALGLPAVLKRGRAGYDGKGQRVLRTPADVEAAFAGLDGGGHMVDPLIAFDREVSMIGVRSRDGRAVFYPLVENVHRDGILRVSEPKPGDEREEEARDHTMRLMEHLDHVGALAVEFFDVGGRLLANEFACRVHNSGHWTIEGAVTSQFENHIRAVLGWPLGSTAPVGPSVMVNLLGRIPRVEDVLSLPGVHLHDYGKRARPGRKVGHATVAGLDPESTRESSRALIGLAGAGLARGSARPAGRRRTAGPALSAGAPRVMSGGSSGSAEETERR